MSNAKPEERLLRLTSWLLGKGEPVTFVEIQEQFPDDYSGAADAVEKKWTRDKQALIEAGVPIAHREGPDSGEGYVIDPHLYYLPDLHLTAEEAAVLWTAGRAVARMGAIPWRGELESSLRKLQCVSPAKPTRRPPLPALYFGPRASGDVEQRLELIGQAVRRRKRLSLRYRGAARGGAETTRDVDVYGFAWRRGVWLFAGHCHLRHDLRVFYVSRVVDVKLNPANPASPDYEIPTTFDIREFSEQQPWEYWFGEEVEAKVRLSPEIAPLAPTLLPGATITPDGDAAIATVKVRDLPSLVSHVLKLGLDAEILSPLEARALAKGMLDRILESHGGAKP